MHQIRHALRALGKTPVVTAIALLSLALGIGANTAIFSLVNALLLRPLPVPHPEQLVALSTLIADNTNGSEPFTLSMFQEIARRQQVFSDVFAWNGGSLCNFEANGIRFVAGLDAVSGNYFSALGVRPQLGRFISPADVAVNAGSSETVAVISYRCWRDRYHSDPHVAGQRLRLNGHPFTVIGVMPPSFSSLIVDGSSDVVIPLFTPGNIHREPDLLWLGLFARLEPGVTLAAARAQMAALWPNVLKATLPPDFTAARRISRFYARKIRLEPASTGNAYMRDRFRRPLLLLLGLVAVVLLIACVNLANLMLARAAARRSEFAVRAALGANTAQLIRPVLTEALLLAFCGGALGLGFSFSIGRLLLRTMWTGTVPVVLDTSPDLRVSAFTAAVSLLTGILFGIAPAWRISRTDLRAALLDNSRSVRGSRSLLDSVLVSGQVALSLTLVVTALLFAQTLQKLGSADLGFKRDHLLVVQLFPQPGHAELSHRDAYYQQLVQKLSQIAGVAGVSYSSDAPANRHEFTDPVLALPRTSESLSQAVREVIGPDFFPVMGMRLLSGRDFTWRDNEGAKSYVVLSDSLSRHLFPGLDPIGRHIEMYRSEFEVIGVVNSASLWKQESRAPLAVYTPLLQQPDYDEPLLVIRAAVDPSTLKTAVGRTIDSLGRHYALRIQTLEERSATFLAEQRLTAMLSAFFGAVALLLAAIGLYGLMSYNVTRRTAELGVRMALGADRPNLLALILREVLWLAVSGILIGLPVTWVASRFFSGLLFGITPSDPATVVIAAAVLLAVALFAGFFPAFRAARLNPVAALRAQT